MATNDEARELNARIRDERVRAGQVDDARTATGSDGLSIGRGDVIQTRQNDSDVQVSNRQTWTVQHVGGDGTVWAKESRERRKHQRTVRLPAEYVAEHTHLAYAIHRLRRAGRDRARVAHASCPTRSTRPACTSA